jgi:hypothetical protein
MGAAEHLAGQQTERRADAFPAGGKQMIDGCLQVRVGILRLALKKGLDFIETGMDGGKKGACIQDRLPVE